MDEPQATPYGTARVADSYGYNPHEHKPSQDTFEAETAEEKQAGTYPPGEGESSPGSSSENSQTSEQSTPEKEQNDLSPAPTAANRSPRISPDSSGAGSTATAGRVPPKSERR